MLGDIWGDLTFANFVKNLVWTVIFAGLTRMALSALKVPIRKEVMYWVSMSMLIFAAISFDVGAGAARPRVKIAPTEITLVEPTGNKSAVIVMTVAVTNTGAPSSVGGYQLQASFPAGHVVVAQRQTIPEKGIALEHSGGLVQWLCGSDAIDRKTVAPVPTGGAVFGQLFYFFPSTTKAMLESIGVKLSLRVVDVWDQVSSWDYEVKAGAIGPIESVRDYPSLTLQPRTGAPPSVTPGVAPPENHLVNQQSPCIRS